MKESKTKKDLQKQLVSKILRVSNAIAQHSRYGAGNWVVPLAYTGLLPKEIDIWI